MVRNQGEDLRVLPFFARGRKWHVRAAIVYYRMRPRSSLGGLAQALAVNRQVSFADAYQNSQSAGAPNYVYRTGPDQQIITPNPCFYRRNFYNILSIARSTSTYMRQHQWQRRHVNRGAVTVISNSC